MEISPRSIHFGKQASTDVAGGADRNDADGDVRSPEPDRLELFMQLQAEWRTFHTIHRDLMRFGSVGTMIGLGRSATRIADLCEKLSQATEQR